MTCRVTLRIDRLTLPAGTQIDQAALSAALTSELRRALSAGGADALGPARSVDRMDAGQLTSTAPDRQSTESALATAIARSLRT